jgi:hypothetical protein
VKLEQASASASAGGVNVDDSGGQWITVRGP